MNLKGDMNIQSITICPWTSKIPSYRNAIPNVAPWNSEVSCNYHHWFSQCWFCNNGSHYSASWASLVAQLVKNLPEMQKTWVWSLGWDNSLEKGKATHSSGCTVHGVIKSRTQLSDFHFHSASSAISHFWDIANGIQKMWNCRWCTMKVKVAQLCPTLYDPTDCGCTESDMTEAT